MTESNKLYRIEQLYTAGWEPVAFHLNREDARTKLDALLNEGISPECLRVIREQ